jgi:hypothetical protein
MTGFQWGVNQPEHGCSFMVLQAGPSALRTRQRRSQGHCRAPMLLRYSKLLSAGSSCGSSVESLAEDRIRRSRALCGFGDTGRGGADEAVCLAFVFGRWRRALPSIARVDDHLVGKFPPARV